MSSTSVFPTYKPKLGVMNATVAFSKVDAISSKNALKLILK